jgi:hypothetical protein
MSARPLARGDSKMMAQHEDLASFHQASRRDKPSTDTARVTMRKISFKPTSRKSSHGRPRANRAPAATPGTDLTASSAHTPRWHAFSAHYIQIDHGDREIAGNGPAERGLHHPAQVGVAIAVLTD